MHFLQADVYSHYRLYRDCNPLYQNNKYLLLDEVGISLF